MTYEPTRDSINNMKNGPPEDDEQRFPTEEARLNWYKLHFHAGGPTQTEEQR